MYVSNTFTNTDHYGDRHRDRERESLGLPLRPATTTCVQSLLTLRQLRGPSNTVWFMVFAWLSGETENEDIINLIIPVPVACNCCAYTCTCRVN